MVGDTSPVGTAVWVSRARWDLFLARVGDAVPGVWLPVLTAWDHWREFEDGARGGRFDQV
ncbi:hypothetical protein DP939_19275 [Spongiactinospora rosea]|uniref:Uncharacterized protein n=1 Tax=Spongiactinospora rosea TaxID=2248750 RepID=A0A366LZ35_9ACTN|nr:hypothetical protein DP939_19275 [Spongiactinospora rosea]